MERANQFVGQSLAFLDAVERASRAAPLNRPVLVIGERGTGKELIAERLHHLSSRWAGPLVTMNCAALPENLIEAELFGHEAGSFTGAAKTRHGRFEEADGGTLFLDELATLSSPAQDRLLRAVEYGEVTRIGASKPISGRRPHRRRDQRASSDAGRAGPVPRRPARPAVVRGRDPAAAAGAERRHPVARRAFRPAHGGRAGLAQLAGLFDARQWPSSRPIRGRAMSASCATSSSAPSIAPRIPSGRSTRSSSTRSIRPGRQPQAAPRRRQPRRATEEAQAPATARLAVAAGSCDQRLPRRRSPPMSGAAGGGAGPQPLQPAGDGGRARPQLRPASPRAEAPQASGFGRLNLVRRSSKCACG